jgi:antiviral helicase SKI2
MYSCAIVELAKLAQDRFIPLCQSWNYEDWDEYDYGRIKTLAFRELDDARRKEGIVATQRECFKCPNFLKHVSGNFPVSFMETDYHSLKWSMASGSLRRTS